MRKGNPSGSLLLYRDFFVAKQPDIILGDYPTAYVPLLRMLFVSK